MQVCGNPVTDFSKFFLLLFSMPVKKINEKPDCHTNKCPEPKCFIKWRNYSYRYNHFFAPNTIVIAGFHMQEMFTTLQVHQRDIMIISIKPFIIIPVQPVSKLIPPGLTEIQCCKLNSHYFFIWL